MTRRLRLLPLFFLVLLCVAHAQPANPVITVDHGPNAAAQQTKHTSFSSPSTASATTMRRNMEPATCWPSLLMARARRKA